MSRMALCALVLCLIVAVRAVEEITDELVRREELSDLPDFDNEAELRVLHALGHVPRQVLSDFEQHKAAVSVVDNHQERYHEALPEDVEELEAILDRQIAKIKATVHRTAPRPKKAYRPVAQRGLYRFRQ